MLDRRWWVTPVIQRLMHGDPNLKNPPQKRAGVVAQGVGPEFKPQCWVRGEHALLQGGDNFFSKLKGVHFLVSQEVSCGPIKATWVCRVCPSSLLSLRQRHLMNLKQWSHSWRPVSLLTPPFLAQQTD
jgi:hypothetical protein